MDKEYAKRIDDAVRELHYVGEDNVIEIYADYRDTGEFLLENLYDNRDSAELEIIINDTISEAYDDTIWNYENEVLKKAGLKADDFELDEGEYILEAEALEYLREKYSFVPPYKHFLDHEMKVNIMLATPEEKNCEYTNIHNQYGALIDPDGLTNPEEVLKENTTLTWLLKQQGHSVDELHAVMKDYDVFFYGEEPPVVAVNKDGNLKSLSERINIFNENHNAFLTSVCQELENQTYDMGVMTVLAKMSIKDFIEMQKGNKEVTMPKDCMIGVYNPWNGSGSVLEIELEKDLVFSSDMIRDVQIEGVKPQFEYTVNDTYGLIGSCWKEPKAIREQTKGLDDVIKTCEAMSKSGALNSEKKFERDER